MSKIKRIHVQLLNSEGFVFDSNSDHAETEVVTASESKLALLDQLEDLGFTLPFGCRSGTCGSCRVKVVEGLDLLRPSGPIEQDTLRNCRDEESVRLSCRAQVALEAEGTLVLQIAAPVNTKVFED